jgi:Transcription elongation factor
MLNQLKVTIIKFGATVEIEDDESREKQQYQIVGEYESDIENKKLSITSPLARGLIGKTVEDNVEINSPKGLKSYTILSIKYV